MMGHGGALHTFVAGMNRGRCVFTHKYHCHWNHRRPRVGFGGSHQLSPFWGQGGGVRPEGCIDPPPGSESPPSAAFRGLGGFTHQLPSGGHQPPSIDRDIRLASPAACLRHQPPSVAPRNLRLRSNPRGICVAVARASKETGERMRTVYVHSPCDVPAPLAPRLSSQCSLN